MCKAPSMEGRREFHVFPYSLDALNLHGGVVLCSLHLHPRQGPSLPFKNQYAKLGYKNEKTFKNCFRFTSMCLLVKVDLVCTTAL